MSSAADRRWVAGRSWTGLPRFTFVCDTPSVLRPTRLVMTTAAVLIPIAVATGSGAPPLSASADLTSDAPVVAAGGSLPVSTVVPPVSPDLTLQAGEARPALAVAGGVDALDIPLAALAAYQRAAAVISQADAACALDWQLLAAVGRVESDHGRVGGATLNPDGTSSPAVRGPVLDGTGPVAAVADTDAGQFDGNARWDRAIGPMQFLPSTWTVVGVDADGDGTRSADDVDDAALGAAVYLCAGEERLDTAAGARAALLRYNPSAAYATRVLAVARAYDEGRYTAPSETSVETIIARSHGAADDASDTAESRPSKHSDTSLAASVIDHATTGAKHPKPAHPTTKPSPGEPAPVDPAPADPAPADPAPADPAPADPAPTDPEPTPPPDVVTGVLAPCPEAAGTWCVGDVVLDLGDDAYLAAAALADFDADGAVESNGEEISGLAGTEVSLEMAGGSTPARVVSVNGVPYVG